jgi:hypothetical protein
MWFHGILRIARIKNPTEKWVRRPETRHFAPADRESFARSMGIRCKLRAVDIGRIRRPTSVSPNPIAGREIRSTTDGLSGARA